MLNIGGELAFILQDIDYNSKSELVEKLKALKKDLKTYPKEKQKQLKPILEILLQQAYCIPKWELKKYRDYLNFRRNYERNKKDKSAD